MRQHFGLHIIKKETAKSQNVCGFCGVVCGNQINLVKGSATNKNYVPKSDCLYFHNFSLKSASKSSARSPCTNRPINCPNCNKVIWSYNAKFHYKEDHPLLELPSILFIEENEKNSVLSLK